MLNYPNVKNPSASSPVNDRIGGGSIIYLGIWVERHQFSPLHLGLIEKVDFDPLTKSGYNLWSREGQIVLMGHFNKANIKKTSPTYLEEL